MALKDKVVVVTGAGRGMGACYVRGFLAEGAKIVALDYVWGSTGVSYDKDESYTEEIRSRNDVLIVTTDITSDAQVRAAYEAAMKRFGTVDVLVNNAGLLQRSLFPPGRPVTTLEATVADFEKSYAVNVFGTLRVTQAFIRPMIEKRSGSIITVVSSGLLMSSNSGAWVARRPWTKEQPYMSAKAALANMMFYLAEEVREHNVAVNLIIPGHTRSTGFDEWADAQVAHGRTRGSATVRTDHVVPVALFLAQQDAKSGNTGKAFEALVWNLEHGLGSAEIWSRPT